MRVKCIIYAGLKFYTIIQKCVYFVTMENGTELLRGTIAHHDIPNDVHLCDEFHELGATVRKFSINARQ